jgi:hypothetical protein
VVTTCPIRSAAGGPRRLRETEEEETVADRFYYVRRVRVSRIETQVFATFNALLPEEMEVVDEKGDKYQFHDRDKYCFPEGEDEEDVLDALRPATVVEVALMDKLREPHG